MQEEQPSPTPPTASWQFSPEGGASPQQQAPQPSHDEAISWTASEFIAHEKSFSWYLKLALGAVALMGLAYLLTQDKITVIMILIVSFFFATFSTRKPRTLPYGIDSSGVHVGERSYGYELFKSFSVIQEGGIRSIMLLPLKRFMPALSIYMDPADEQRIVDVLATYLPVEDRKQDAIETLMRRLRF